MINCTLSCTGIDSTLANISAAQAFWPRYLPNIGIVKQLELGGANCLCQVLRQLCQLPMPITYANYLCQLPVPITYANYLYQLPVPITCASAESALSLPY